MKINNNLSTQIFLIMVVIYYEAIKRWHVNLLESQVTFNLASYVIACYSENISQHKLKESVAILFGQTSIYESSFCLFYTLILFNNFCIMLE